MFEVWKKYTITMLEDGEERDLQTLRPNCVVIEEKLPLVKFDQYGSEWIVNVSSPKFVCARPS